MCTISAHVFCEHFIRSAWSIRPCLVFNTSVYEYNNYTLSTDCTHWTACNTLQILKSTHSNHKSPQMLTTLGTTEHNFDKLLQYTYTTWCSQYSQMHVLMLWTLWAFPSVVKIMFTTLDNVHDIHKCPQHSNRVYTWVPTARMVGTYIQEAGHEPKVNLGAFHETTV